MHDILKVKNSNDVVFSKRREIYESILQQSENIKSGTIAAISEQDLEIIFSLYDRIFFENWFKENYKGKLKFSLSKRMVKSAGSTLCPKNISKIKMNSLVIEIRIGVDFLFQYGMIEGNKAVGGIKTKDSLEALQLVFEHELCHVIEFVHFKESNCKKDRFKILSNNLFGHTESHHKLPTYKQIAYQKLGFKIGDTVSFTFKGKRYDGILNNINKRAVVLVKDNKGRFIDNKGNRYCKYYVQLSLLE